MSYKINFTDTLSNPQGITIQDQSLNNTVTDLVFVGKNFPGYSEFIGENFLHLLENFSRNTPPSKPVKGQLWYNTGTNTVPAKPQLMVFDGTSWTEAGNIKKGAIRPASENSIVGDLWVDAANQQLYLYTGTTWVLVGPQFNESSNTGFRVESFIDSVTNTERLVISFIIEEKRVLIISRYEFVPKIRIDGFTVIQQGLNLSREDFNLNGASNKFWGVSEKANALVVGNSTIAASNFLRSDAASTTDFEFSVRSGAGLNVGPGLETSITSSSAGTVILQKNPGSSITLRTTPTQGSFNNSLIVLADGKVGINKIPTEFLDVNGNFLVSGTAKVTNDTNSTSTSNGAFTVAGGAGISKDLNIGGNFAVTGRTILGPLTESSQVILIPRVSNLFDIGTSTTRFRNIYARSLEADEFIGNFVGFLSGNVSGSAASLTTTVNFTLSGDVVSNSIPFNGTNGVVLDTVIGPEIISTKEEVTDSRVNDEFLIYRAPNLKRINKATLFASVGTVPIGSIFPFGGDTPPSGYLFCDGSEQSISLYNSLFSVLGFKYRAEQFLIGFQTFALPDLRGRFPVGLEGMDNRNTISKQISATSVTRQQVFENAISAIFVIDNENIVNGPFQVGRSLLGTGLNSSDGPVIVSNVQNNVPESGKTTLTVSCQPQSVDVSAVTNLTITSVGITDAGGGPLNPSRVSNASTLGNVGGSSTLTLSVTHLPEHTHDLSDSVGNQYYAINSSTDPIPEANVSNGNIRFTSGEGHLLSNSGGINTAGSIGQPIDIANPYLTVNYIIFTGRI